MRHALSVRNPDDRAVGLLQCLYFDYLVEFMQANALTSDSRLWLRDLHAHLLTNCLMGRPEVPLS